MNQLLWNLFLLFFFISEVFSTLTMDTVLAWLKDKGIRFYVWK